MTDNDLRREGFEQALDLARAVQKAGGTIPSFAVLDNMSVVNFCTTTAAQNNIRFAFEPKEKKASDGR